MSEWQPIETAPRDGHTVLLAMTNDDMPFVTAGHCIRDEWYELGEWGTDLNDEPLKPTHWMPFPDLPKLGRSTP